MVDPYFYLYSKTYRESLKFKSVPNIIPSFSIFFVCFGLFILFCFLKSPNICCNKASRCKNGNNLILFLRTQK